MVYEKVGVEKKSMIDVKVSPLVWMFKRPRDSKLTLIWLCFRSKQYKARRERVLSAKAKHKALCFAKRLVRQPNPFFFLRGQND